jgi:hypothetical protein
MNTPKVAGLSQIGNAQLMRDQEQAEISTGPYL